VLDRSDRFIYPAGRLLSKTRQVIKIISGLPSLSARCGEGPVLGGGGMPTLGDVRDTASGPERGLSCYGLNSDAVLSVS